MAFETATGEPTKGAFYTGWTLTVLIALFIGSSAVNSLRQAPMVVDSMAKYGFDASFLPYLALTEALCVILYLVPQTALIGALLLTAFMGGAVVTHARAHEINWIIPVIFGVLVWVALFLRRPHLRKSLGIIA